MHSLACATVEKFKVGVAEFSNEGGILLLTSNKSQNQRIERRESSNHNYERRKRKNYLGTG